VAPGNNRQWKRFTTQGPLTPAAPDRSGNNDVDFEGLIDEYVRAWNARNLERMLELLDPRATYYDGLWMEYVSSREVPAYLQSCLDEEHYRIQRAGDVVPVGPDAAYYRYAAYEQGEGDAESLAFHGVEVFSFRDNKIFTISDFYCDPSPTVLAEVARIATRYHGETRHVEVGLGAMKAMRYKRRLLKFIEQDQVYLNPELTQLQLATFVGCTGTQLTRLLEEAFGTNFLNFIDRYRVNHAKGLLAEATDDRSDLDDIARQSGYKSSGDFRSAFRRIARETPQEFRDRKARTLGASID